MISSVSHLVTLPFSNHTDASYSYLQLGLTETPKVEPSPQWMTWEVSGLATLLLTHLRKYVSEWARTYFIESVAWESPTHMNWCNGIAVYVLIDTSCLHMPPLPSQAISCARASEKLIFVTLKLGAPCLLDIVVVEGRALLCRVLTLPHLININPWYTLREIKWNYNQQLIMKEQSTYNKSLTKL